MYTFSKPVDIVGYNFRILKILILFFSSLLHNLLFLVDVFNNGFWKIMQKNH